MKVGQLICFETDILMDEKILNLCLGDHQGIKVNELYRTRSWNFISWPKPRIFIFEKTSRMKLIFSYIVIYFKIINLTFKFSGAHVTRRSGRGSSRLAQISEMKTPDDFDKFTHVLHGLEELFRNTDIK